MLGVEEIGDGKHLVHREFTGRIADELSLLSHIATAVS
jgi:hypothetical protein